MAILPHPGDGLRSDPSARTDARPTLRLMPSAIASRSSSSPSAEVLESSGSGDFSARPAARSTEAPAALGSLLLSRMDAISLPS